MDDRSEAVGVRADGGRVSHELFGRPWRMW